VTKRPLVAFFTLTCAVTWVCWAIGGALLRRGALVGTALSTLVTPAFLLGTFAPSLVALALTARADGRAAAGDLFGRVFKWDVGARWYVFAASYMVVVKLTAAAIHRVAMGAWPRFGTESWFVMAAALLISTWAQAGEEIGWRGYALPRLSSRLGLGPASVVLGVIWACWHLPLFFMPAGDTFGQSFPLYLLQVMAMSVAMAWLYWRTGGSLLLVMLLHAAANNTKDIVPSNVPGATDTFALSTSLVAWIAVGLMWIAAAYFLVHMKKTRMAG
jgi:membrane protease YdiL (CAAX protease family)